MKCCLVQDRTTDLADMAGFKVHASSRSFRFRHGLLPLFNSTASSSERHFFSYNFMMEYTLHWQAFRRISPNHLTSLVSNACPEYCSMHTLKFVITFLHRIALSLQPFTTLSQHPFDWLPHHPSVRLLPIIVHTLDISPSFNSMFGPSRNIVHTPLFPFTF